MYYSFKNKSIINDFTDKNKLANLWYFEKKNLYSYKMKVSLLKNKKEFLEKLNNKDIIFPINYDNNYCGLITFEKWGQNDEISFWLSKDSIGKINFQNYLKEAIDYQKNTNKNPVVWGIRFGNSKSYYLSKKYNFIHLFMFYDLISEFDEKPIPTLYSCNYDLVENKQTDLFNEIIDFDVYEFIFNNLLCDKTQTVCYGNRFFIYAQKTVINYVIVNLINLCNIVYDQTFTKKYVNTHLKKLIRQLCKMYPNIDHISIAFDIEKNLFIINVNLTDDSVWLEFNPINLYWL